MEEMALAIQASTSPIVQVWMNWMNLVFVISVIFAWKYKAARIVFASYILTLPVGLLIFNISKSTHLIGIAHILLWGPLAFYLFKYEIRSPTFRLKSVYGIWLCLLLSTISISLIFDIRGIILVSMGA